MIVRLWYIVSLIALGPWAFGQKSTEVRDQLWVDYLNQTRLTNRSGIWTDLNIRFTDHKPAHFYTCLDRARARFWSFAGFFLPCILRGSTL